MVDVEIDSVDLRDCNVFGVLWFIAATIAAMFAVSQLFVGNFNVTGWALAATVTFATFGLVTALPEYEGTCDACNRDLVVNDGDDDVTEFVEVYRTGAPERIRVGGYSFVLRTKSTTKHYCTPKCASRDARVVVGERDQQAIADDDRWEVTD